MGDHQESEYDQLAASENNAAGQSVPLRELSDGVTNHGFFNFLESGGCSPRLLSKYMKDHSADDFVEILRKDSNIKPHFESASCCQSVADCLYETFCCCCSVPQFRIPPLEDFPEIRERDGNAMKAYPSKSPFENWGRTVSNKPLRTFLPTTRDGVQNIVRWANTRELSVRVVGYRHTWTEFFSSDDQVLIALLSNVYTDRLPEKTAIIDPDNELQRIEILSSDIDGGKALCKIGPAVTNEMFRKWAIKNSWTVPQNVILVENCFGGTNAMLCHGSGIMHKTMSDLVREIEFVNPLGEIQVVNDRDHLTAAGGCFGIFGPVLSVTLELDRMTYAVMSPEKRAVALTIPPPDFDANQIPAQLRRDGVPARADMEAAWNRFVSAAENNYYTEYFWFCYNSQCYVNTWQNNGLERDVETYPSEFLTASETALSFLSNVLNQRAFVKLPGALQARVMSALSMAALPAERKTTYLIDALHFQRGIQNVQVRDFELEIPLTARSDDPFNPDWSIVQQAWWDLINLVYERFPIDSGNEETPFRLAMELRVMGGSNMILAAQKGNDLGTCSIEVLTPQNVPLQEWNDFIQIVCDKWTSYEANGAKLNSRPLWAKQWPPKFNGLPADEGVKLQFQPQIDEFFAQVELICAEGGYSVADLRRFCSPAMLKLFGDRLLK